ncbi:MAG TPA: hypothetical protein VGR26_02030 [Acidimicrobiales bacterium]|nr:hypothetical protein [Acidimicrobiales bacterium]
MATTDASTTTQICDIGFHRFTGEAMEVRTGNWLEPTDMVCVMVTCAEHADMVGAQSRHWWEHWLDDEGGAWGYTSLS